MANTDMLYDVIVVGAGVEGSSAAYSLAKMGKKTLLIEQFSVLHERGSSHGSSRTTRMAYGPKEGYTRMMKEAFALTEQLQHECGEQLFVKCGCLFTSQKGSEYMRSTEILSKFGLPFETFGVEEQRRRYPCMWLPENFECLLDKSAGLLRADRMLKAFQHQFVRFGGTICDNEPMVDLCPGDPVSIQTSKGIYKGRSVVLALGPWAPKFLPKIGVHLPLQTVQIHVCYWKIMGQSDMFSVNNFPAFFIDQALGKYQVYGLPSFEHPGLVKICLHDGPVIDVDRRDDVNNQWSLDQIKHVIAKHFPTLEKEPEIVETCIYTNTPDEDPVLDYHPAWGNVVIAAGFSGHGFKLSPIVGKLLGQLATGQKPSYDMTPFKLSRFFKNKL